MPADITANDSLSDGFRKLGIRVAFIKDRKDDRTGGVYGDEGMTCLHNNRTRRSQLAQYRTSKNFCQIFAEHLNPLYLLSFLMTGDHKLAERCFVAGLEECVQSNHIFSEWAHCWAKRIIVQNAIRALQPSPLHVNASQSTFTRNRREPERVSDFGLYRVLALADFERFIFVMSVLEHYSDHDCALLLGCSRREVLEGRVRALERMGDLGRTEPSREVAASARLVRCEQHETI